MDVLSEYNGKLYATARAHIVERPEDLPREMASALDREQLNPSFLWIAGRYVQANKPNRNGHYWTFADLERGESTIHYTPMNVLHKWDKPVGTFVETKIVHREDRAGDTEDLLPEIQALGVLWAANFPQIAQATRAAHDAGKLWYSMECVAESKQCLTCENVFAFAAQAHEVCEHMRASATSPRRFINPTFLGGALVFPPARPGWADADITEVAQEYAQRSEGHTSLSVDSWERMMSDVVSVGT